METNYEALTSTKDYLDWDKKVVVKVSLLWLLRSVNDSCDGYDLSTFDGWKEMFAHKTSDTGFGHLVESIMERGFLPEGSIGYRTGRITEGHHRLCAAVLLGLDEVYVSKGGANIRKPGAPNTWGNNLVCAHDHESNGEGLEAYPIEVLL